MNAKGWDAKGEKSDTKEEEALASQLFSIKVLLCLPRILRLEHA